MKPTEPPPAAYNGENPGDGRPVHCTHHDRPADPGRQTTAGQRCIPAGQTVAMVADSLNWRKARPTGLHIASMDWQHGFSLQPQNINVQILPGYEMVLTITPDTSGDQTIICNEYCGIGHHNMVGKILVAEGGS